MDTRNQIPEQIDTLRLRLETERKSAAVENLWRVCRDDSTVNAFLHGWQRGYFPTFEEMLCSLAIQLAAEKAEYMRTATKVIQFEQAPQFIVDNDRRS
jgi:hypothetical protein